MVGGGSGGISGGAIVTVVVVVVSESPGLRLWVFAWSGGGGGCRMRLGGWGPWLWWR